MQKSFDIFLKQINHLGIEGYEQVLLNTLTSGNADKVYKTFCILELSRLDRYVINKKY
ncbi:hypothetical protein LCGC14_1641890 [marine sediment metagenome]|uniref:Uncharacterized protein n=1 Tax=marine sediment metagenome TaxID=412755 RepID=A0A0F9KZ23_9ZZZZ